MEWVVTNGTFDKDSKEILSKDEKLRWPVESGHLPMLKWWFEKYGASNIILSKKLFTKAAAARQSAENLNPFSTNHFRTSSSPCDAAALVNVLLLKIISLAPYFSNHHFSIGR